MQQCTEFIPQIPMGLQILFVLSDAVNIKEKNNNDNLWLSTGTAFWPCWGPRAGRVMTALMASASLPLISGLSEVIHGCSWPRGHVPSFRREMYGFSMDFVGCQGFQHPVLVQPHSVMQPLQTLLPTTSLSLPALFMCTRSILINEREGCSRSIRIPLYAKKDKLRLIQRTDLKNALCYLDKCNLPREPLEWAVLRSCLYLFAKINGQCTELHSYRRYLFQPTTPSDFT